MYKYVIEHSLFKFLNYHEHKKITRHISLFRKKKIIIIILMIATLGNLHYAINSR